MSKKKTKSKARVSIEMQEDGTYGVKYEFSDAEHLTYEEFKKLVDFVNKVISGECEGF